MRLERSHCEVRTFLILYNFYFFFKRYFPACFAIGIQFGNLAFPSAFLTWVIPFFQTVFVVILCVGKRLFSCGKISLFQEHFFAMYSCLFSRESSLVYVTVSPFSFVVISPSLFTSKSFFFGKNSSLLIYCCNFAPVKCGTDICCVDYSYMVGSINYHRKKFNIDGFDVLSSF